MDKERRKWWLDECLTDVSTGSFLKSENVQESGIRIFEYGESEGESSGPTTTGKNFSNMGTAYLCLIQLALINALSVNNMHKYHFNQIVMAQVDRSCMKICN